MTEPGRPVVNPGVVSREGHHVEEAERAAGGQTSLLRAFEETRWPDPAAFPLNAGGHRVGTTVEEELRTSTRFLAVTGFTSLAYLVRALGREDADPDQTVEVVLGNEPLPARAVRGGAHTVTDELREYWLERGISILVS